MYKIHVHDLTFISGGVEDGGGVTGQKDAKPVNSNVFVMTKNYIF